MGVGNRWIKVVIQLSIWIVYEIQLKLQTLRYHSQRTQTQKNRNQNQRHRYPVKMHQERGLWRYWHDSETLSHLVFSVAQFLLRQRNPQLNVRECRCHEVSTSGCPLCFEFFGLLLEKYARLFKGRSRLCWSMVDYLKGSRFAWRGLEYI